MRKSWLLAGLALTALALMTVWRNMPAPPPRSPELASPELASPELASPELSSRAPSVAAIEPPAAAGTAATPSAASGSQAMSGKDGTAPLGETANSAPPADSMTPGATAAAGAPAASPQAAAPQTASPQTAAPPTAALPALPTRAVGEWRTHAVPEDAEPPPPKPIDLRLPSGAAVPRPAQPPQAAAAPKEAAAIGPSFRPFASLQVPGAPGDSQPRAASPPAAAPRGAAGARTTGPQIAGAGEASGATALRVNGTALYLFGIRPPASGDRCISGGSATLSSGAQARSTLPCLEQAEGILAARLARKATVSCRFPGQARPDGPAICLDGDGVDLAGLLVAEGLALADPAQSYDYVGAEGIARQQKRGLWLFR